MDRADFEPTAFDFHVPTQPMDLDALPTLTATVPGPGLAPLSKPRRASTAHRKPAPTDADCVRISGVLVSDAAVRFAAAAEAGATQRRAWLGVRMAIPGGLLVDAAQDAGTTTAEHHQAIGRARYLRAGQRVTVWAKGAMTMDKRGETVLVLLLPQIFIDTAPAPAAPA